MVRDYSYLASDGTMTMLRVAVAEDEPIVLYDLCEKIDTEEAIKG
jgi:hypothetical protein